MYACMHVHVCLCARTCMLRSTMYTGRRVHCRQRHLQHYTTLLYLALGVRLGRLLPALWGTRRRDWLQQAKAAGAACARPSHVPLACQASSALPRVYNLRLPLPPCPPASKCSGFTLTSEDSSEVAFLLVENYNYDRSSWPSGRLGIFDTPRVLCAAFR